MTPSRSGGLAIRPASAGALVAAVALAAGLRWGTFAVGGSDSSCYAHQAERWASGRLQIVNTLALEAPWPSATLTLTPAGHIPSPTMPGAAVPICPPGLSLAMAPFHAFGGPDGIFFVVPLFGALLVWSTYFLGAEFAPRVGLAAAAATACSPAFLMQLMQPMSDVPAAAWWTLATALILRGGRRALVFAGLATSAAILTRPNLLPLGATLGVFLLVRPERPRRGCLGDAAAYAAASAPGCFALLLIQQSLYGSPFGSGYGSMTALFALEHVGPNVRRYGAWFWRTHTPFVLLGLAAPWATRRRATVWLLLTLAAVNVCCYLPYAVFEDWWYLRFLLPAIPIAIVLAFATLDAALSMVAAMPRHAARVTLAAVTVLLCAALLVRAHEGSVFRLQQFESRFVRAGQFVARRLPPNTIVLTGWQSGSIRYYAGRQALAWDVLDPDWLDRSLAFLRARGYDPVLLLERWEEPRFRQRFAANPLSALDWPPILEMRGGVRIYRFNDQARYYAGEPVQTEYAR